MLILRNDLWLLFIIIYGLYKTFVYLFLESEEYMIIYYALN